jgi:hypothetical protein
LHSTRIVDDEAEVGVVDAVAEAVGVEDAGVVGEGTSSSNEEVVVFNNVLLQRQRHLRRKWSGH